MSNEKSWLEFSRIKGQPVKSLTVLLKTRGCSYAKAKQPCRFCAFHGFAKKNPKELGPEKLRTKLATVISGHNLEEEGIKELKIYNGGSFFANAELRPKEREAVLSVVAGFRFRKLLVESRPEHITARKIEEAMKILSPMELEVAIGLETMDDALRSSLKKGFTLADFERATCVLAEFGTTMGAYVLIKPVPMSEEGAEADTLSTLEYLARLRERLGIPISARLQPFTHYEGMEAGHTPVSLATVIRIIKNAPEGLDLFVGWSEGESVLSSAAQGTAATELKRIKGLVDMFNSTGNRRLFDAGGVVGKLIAITTYMPNGNSMREFAFEMEQKGVYLTISGKIITIEKIKG